MLRNVVGISTAILLLSAVAQDMPLADKLRIIAESAPLDDQVLATQPVQLDLRFAGRVRLVKLALYNERRDWVDINFRYDPRPDTQFSWPIPLLRQAEFYSAEWAVLNSDDQLLRGSFSFSFGAGAERPAVIRERLGLIQDLSDESELLLELQRLGLDPAEIIINNQPSPVFEPPFAPVLN
ncbi:MAG: copper resistance protein CopC [Pseudohongiellaceae bacterium]